MALPVMQDEVTDAALPDMSADGLAALTLEDTQLQELNNRFIEGQQEALFGAPDALYRLSGAEAVAAAPRTLARLAELKATLGELVPDGEAGGELGPQLARQLDLHLASTAAEVRRHVARETWAWQEGVVQQRIALARRQAGLEYRDPRKVDLLAEAGAESAREIARLRGRSGDAMVEGPARSTVYRGAIEQALAQADTGAALKLYDAAQPHLAGDDGSAVEVQIAIARQAEKARAWIEADPPPASEGEQFPFDAPRLLAEIAAWRAAATARNEAEFADDADQQATVQHAIDVAADRQARDMHLVQAKLDNDVRDWLSKPGPDGAPQTARPPPILWAQLSPEQRQAVGEVLKANVGKTEGAAEVGGPYTIVDPSGLGGPYTAASGAEARQLALSPRRRITSIVESHNLTFRTEKSAAAGEVVRLKDGSTIPDPKSPTGFVMAPVNNLAEVAAAGRRVGASHAFAMMDPQTASVALFVFAAGLGALVGQGGKYDYQRDGNRLTGYKQLPHFRNISNINVGLVGEQAGLTLHELLTISGLFAQVASSNYKPDEPYGLDPQTREFIEFGYNLGKSGMYGRAVTAPAVPDSPDIHPSWPTRP